MFEPTNTTLQKFLSLTIGILLLSILVILCTRFMSTSSAPSSMYVSGNPNVVAGSIDAVTNDLSNATNSISGTFGQTFRSSGHELRIAPRPLIHFGRWSGHLVGNIMIHTLKFSASVMLHSTRFIGEILIGTVKLMWIIPEKCVLFVGHLLLNVAIFTASSTSNMFTFVLRLATMSNLTKPSTMKSVPTINPNIAAFDFVQASSTATPVPAVVQPAAVSIPQTKSVPVPVPVPEFAPNDYAWGNCTWWVAIRRSQINDPIPNTWGNAASWADLAADDGYVVNHVPSPGAIMQLPNVDYGLGHVAFVESVESDGTWNISEMNVLGIDVVDHKSMPAGAAADYYFIHDRD